MNTGLSIVSDSFLECSKFIKNNRSFSLCSFILTTRRSLVQATVGTTRVIFMFPQAAWTNNRVRTEFWCAKPKDSNCCSEKRTLLHFGFTWQNYNISNQNAEHVLRPKTKKQLLIIIELILASLPLYLHILAVLEASLGGARTNYLFQKKQNRVILPTLKLLVTL